MSKMNVMICALTVGLLASCAGPVASGDEYSVGRVSWKKTDSMKADTFLKKEIPNNSASVFFLRAADGDSVESSANVAINGRFQVSLQPGNYSHVYTCNGTNGLSVDVASHKSNGLGRNLTPYKLEEGKHYFFVVDVNDAGYPSLAPVEAEKALALITNMQKQAHQISRTVNNCNDIIELTVLFDTDKSVVKQQYYNEVEHVANYMKKYQKARVTIEGHTDSQASDAYNIALSKRRAAAVRALLVKQFGIHASRIQIVGYGESRPVGNNTTAEGRRANRRVIAVFSDK